MTTSAPLSLDTGLQTLLSRADLAIGRLDGATQTLPDADLFASMYMRKEAVLSCRIDGNRTSLDEVLAAEARIATHDTPRDVEDVLACVRAMNRGMARLATMPVSARLAQDLRQQLLSPAGARPPVPDEVPQSLVGWERFVRSGEPMPALIRIGLAYAQLEAAGPFPEGGGRVGRLLISLLLIERGLLRFPVLYLSQHLERQRARYHEMLRLVRDAGALEEWIDFFLGAVAEVADDAARTARRIVELRERHRAAVTRELGRGAATGLRVLESLYSRPMISVADVAELTSTTFTGANQLVQRLVQSGVLVEMTGNRRNRKFRYDEYVRLFSDHAD